jgi:NADPH:quinone reductase-like Zn-dependent oxidoreductase/acyl carrier protein
MVDLSAHPSPSEIETLMSELASPGDEDEITLRDDKRYVQRLVRTSLKKFAPDELLRVNPTVTPVQLANTSPGVLENLKLKTLRLNNPDRGQVQVQVVAAGLNFRDVMKALGIYPSDEDDHLLLGDECSGIVCAVGEGVGKLKVGDEVIALSPMSFSSYTTTKAEFVVPKPTHLSFQEAATIPVAFLTAYYALHHLGRIARGERVLIHAAAGGVGLAAVQLAQRSGAQIFATAGSTEKRDFLSSLGVHHVMDSRSLSFADEIMDIAHGKGVDIVLNSLAGEAIQKSLSCLSPYGRFLEIGKRDIYENNKLGLRPFRNNLSYFAIDLARVMQDRPALTHKLLVSVVKLFNKNELLPLPHKTYFLGDVASAFRDMAQAKHIGKIVVSIADNHVTVEPELPGAISLRNDATYLITGGLGGFGLAVARWMADNGARHLVLMGRSGVTTEEAQSTISTLECKGITIVVERADVGKKEDVGGVFGRIIASLPPLRGIVHAAMVLDDGILLQLNADRFKRVMEPKVLGAWHLHTLTLSMPLDFFILFSSVTTMLGNPGQANYVAANAFLDSLAHLRRSLNLPAFAINWGHLSDVGYLARNADVAARLESAGIRGFTAANALKVMERLMVRGKVQSGVMNINWHQWAYVFPSDISPRLSLLAHHGQSSGLVGENHQRIREILIASQPAERHEILVQFLKEQVAKVLGMSASKVDADQPLNGMGLDSLMMVELKNRIEKETSISFPAVELMVGPSVRELSRVLLNHVSASLGSSAARQPAMASPVPTI